MVSRVQLRRSVVPGSAPASMLSGELAVNQADLTLYLGAPDGTAVVLTAVRNWTGTINYAAGSFVSNQGFLWRSKTALPPEPWTVAHWDKITTNPQPPDGRGALTNDGAGNFTYVDPLTVAVSKAGDTMSGPLALPGPPTQANQAATKAYIDAIVLAAGSVSSVVGAAGAVSLNNLVAGGVASQALSGNNAGRNRMHNPCFAIRQRGGGPWTTGGPLADRWRCFTGAGGTRSISIIALTGTDRTQIGDESALNALSYQFTGGAAAGDMEGFAQDIEGVYPLSGKTVMVSFWARAAVAGVKVAVELGQVFGTGGSPSAPVTGIGSTAFTLTTAWARYSAAITVPSASGKSFGAAGTESTTLDIFLSSGSTNAARAANIGVQSGTASFWGFQLEPGSTMTTFDRPSASRELEECLRFYQTGVFKMGGNATAAGVGFYFTQSLPVPMRTVPTVALSVNSSLNFTGITLFSVGPAGIEPYAVSIGAGGLGLDANYTASAEF